MDGTLYVINNSNDVLNLIFRFAIERTDSHISIWFWSRCSLFVPFEVKEGLKTVDPLTWVCKFLSTSIFESTSSC